MRLVGLVVIVAACGNGSPPAPAKSPTMPATPASPSLSAPPAELVASWKLSPRHAKYLGIGGFPVLGSTAVSDAALREAGHLIDQMIGHRPDVLRALAANQVRFVVMATTELTTDVPEHADLEPKDYWDRRARGLGATSARPAVSCGEENLLNLDGDPYATENILVHEFAHAIHEMAVATLDPTFDRRLREAYDAARAAGRWANTYAMDNHMEYWAEGAQSWFDTNRTNDNVHGPIGSRTQLVTYDPPLAALLTEVFGDRPWRYHKLTDRDDAGRAHLAGWTRTGAPTFAWPSRIATLDLTHPALAAASVPLSPQPIARSPGGTTPAARLAFANQRGGDVVVEWMDFAGSPVPYRTLAPGTSMVQSTYVGHVFRVRDGSTILGYVAAPAGDSRVDVR